MDQLVNQTTPLAHVAAELLDGADRDTLLRLARTFIRVEELLDLVHDLNQLLELVMRESEQAVGAETSSLLLFDSDSRELYFEVALGPQGDQVKQVRLPLDRPSIAASAALTRTPINIPDVSADTRWDSSVDQITNFETRNILAVPMLRNERLIGVIEVLNKREGEAFSEEDVGILRVLASMAAIAIENALLYQQNIQAERLAALGQAVASVSHYIKNVLTGLRGSISLIEGAIAEEDHNVLLRATQILRRSYGRIEDLVKDMLTFSRRHELQLLPLDPVETVKEICEPIVEAAQAKGISFTTDLPEDTPCIHSDQEALERILLNLLTNAIDAIYELKQRHTNHLGVIEVTLSVTSEDNLVLTVKDNGPGIAPTDLKRIWTPFFTTKGTTGTGLGLAVSRKLAEDLGGRLSVNTAVSEGSTFKLTLPITPPRGN